MSPSLPGLFVTGTDTGVGKTWITALIVREMTAAGIRCAPCKPVCTGAETAADGTLCWEDVERLYEAAGGRYDRDLICPQRFRAPLAPPVAARLEGAAVDALGLRRCVHGFEGTAEMLVVEGVGGLLCPLTANETVAELAGDLGYPLVIVGRLGLGTINHTLLTVEAAQRRGLAVAGVVLNEDRPAADDRAARTNPAEIAARSPAAVLGVVRHNETHLAGADGHPVAIDWRRLAINQFG